MPNARHVVLLILALSRFAAAQESFRVTARTPDLAYDRGKVFLRSGERFDATSLVYAGDSLSFNIFGSPERRTVPLRQVTYASRAGNRVGEGALGGGALMLLSGMLAVAQVQNDPNAESVSNPAGVVAIATASGIAIGAIIGAFIPKEMSVVQDGRLMVNVGEPAANGRPGRALALVMRAPF